MADGSLHGISVVPEIVYGETPATPAMVKQRITGVTLGLEKDTLESAEIRDDRQVAAVKHGTRQVGGDLNGELSYETWDLFMEAVLGGTWTADVLDAGLTRRSFSILREFPDLASGDSFFLFKGCEINNLAMEVTPESIVTTQFSMVGQDQVISATAPTGATYVPPNTNKVIDAFTGAIEEGGVDIAVVTAVSLSFENGIEPRFVVGSQTTIRPSIGRFRVSGSMTTYFDDGTMLAKFISETDSSLKLTLADVDGNSYEILIPRIVLTSGKPDVESEGPITLQMEFVAVYDETESTNIRITRAAA